MTAADIVAALALPKEALLRQRVPKKLLVEHGAPTAADKRQINDGIEELLWVAVLKPETVGVPAYRDANREYLEIAVLSLALRPEAKAPRLVELIHRAIPYPVVLITTQASVTSVSMAPKRLAQNEAGRVVLDATPISCSLEAGPVTAEWLVGLAIAAQPRAHLLALYQGWIARLEALLAAHITGRLAASTDPATQEARRQALADHARLLHDIATLRAQAEKETQLSQRVAVNLEVKRLETQLVKLAADL